MFTNSGGTATTNAATLSVGVAPGITSASSTLMVAESFGTFTVVATGTPVPVLKETGSLPAGVTFSPTTGVLSGTPTAFGSFAITLTASNGIEPDATQNFTLNVSGIPATATSLDERFVAQVYLDVLNRVVDQGALGYWSGLLDQGLLTRTQVAQELIQSTEYRTGEIQSLYEEFLGRAADSSSIGGWLSYLAGGGTNLSLEIQLLGSQEYFQNKGGGTNAGFLSALYESVLGWAIDPGALENFGNALQLGIARTVVATEVANSSESFTRTVQADFQLFLRTSPTSSQQTTYVDQLQAGTTNDQVSASLIGSAQYAQNAGGDANEVFVRHIYSDLLGAAPSSNTLTTITGLLDAGQQTRQQVVQTLLTSSAYYDAVVQNVFQTYLHRTADPGAIQSLASSLALGATDESVAATVLGSQEFFAANGNTNDGFLGALFQDVLGRAIDPSSQAAFEKELSAGATRTQVAEQIFGSSEYLHDEVNSLYEHLLNRAADPAGLAGFVQILQNGSRDESVIAALVSSAEYFTKS